MFSAFLLGFGTPASAIVLDDFNGASVSGWTTTLNGGTFVQSAGQLAVTPVAFPNALTYGKKTTLTFTNLATHTLEFRVLVNGILTNSVTTNGLAVLGWVPTGGALGANGYALGVGPLGAAILFNASFVYITNFVTALPTNDMYLVLRMTPEGANVIAKSTVYKKADGRFNVLFEHTLTNTTATLIGTGGNAVLGYPDYVCRVTADEGDIGRGHMQRFQDVETRTPVILTTSQLLTTGLDAPTCRNVVLVRLVNSMVEFKQIIGRGTRVRDDYGKLWFNILDYTGTATRNFADPNCEHCSMEVAGTAHAASHAGRRAPAPSLPIDSSFSRLVFNKLRISAFCAFSRFFAAKVSRSLPSPTAIELLTSDFWPLTSNPSAHLSSRCAL